MSTTYSLKFGRFIELKKTTFTKNVQVSVCKNKSCKNFDIELDGNFCPECGENLFFKDVEEDFDTVSYIKNIMFKNGDDPDIFSSEYYNPKIIYFEEMMNSTTDEFKIIDIKKEIKKLPETTKTYQKVLLLLKKENISFEVKTGAYLAVG